MKTYTREEIFELYYNNKIWQRDAIEKGGFRSYSDFQDAYFSAGYGFPIISEDELNRQVEEGSKLLERHGFSI